MENLMNKMPFNNNKYIQIQKDAILSRIQNYERLYIEVGGKIFDDYHASRVLPGFEPNVKIQILKELKNDLEIIFCINARHIIAKKLREDYGLTYDNELLRLIGCMRDIGISVCGVVINFYEDHPLVEDFKERCAGINVPTYRSYYMDCYPSDINKVVSQDGFGYNDHVKTTKKIVLVSAPGASSGKLEVCLSQLYHDKLNGITSGYAKYETFPVWNLPTTHLVNVAYEMATADLLDYNIIDPFHKAATGKIAVNYNRDIDAFPLLSKILKMIYGEDVYASPTAMGINNVGFAIENDKAVQKACMQEIERRWDKIKTAYKNFQINTKTFERSLELVVQARELYSKLDLE